MFSEMFREMLHTNTQTRGTLRTPLVLLCTYWNTYTFTTGTPTTYTRGQKPETKKHGGKPQTQKEEGTRKRKQHRNRKEEKGEGGGLLHTYSLINTFPFIS